MLRLIECTEDKQKVYRFAEGHRGERGNPVSSNNLRIALGLQSGKLTERGEDLSLDDVLFMLKENHRTLDSTFAIRYVFGEPLLNIRCGYIGSIVNMHIEACESKKIEPESSMIHLLWTPEMGQRMAMKIDRKTTTIPETEQGAINMYDGNQVVFSYREWHLVPLSDRVLSVRKHLQVTPTFAKSVKDLCTNGMIVVEDGRVIRDGLCNLWVMNMELDKVIVDVDLDGFKPTQLDGPDDQNDTPMTGAGA